ncbi:MAG TPA: CPBP family intramembrane metalloprotease [Candidatus Atribacteria bacterium]|nr:CPBP family intramembrane metalloprotease [Candidatus Atribacteria bacterium]
MNYLKSIYTPVKFNPKKDLVIALFSWLLVVGSLSIATYLITSQRGLLYFLFYAVIGATIFGISLPAYWTLIKKRESLDKLGITKKNLKISIAAQILLAIILYYNKIDILLGKEFSELFPLITLVLAIGFFEAVFWRGWILTNLEDSFGTIPAVILGSLLYAAYHIGYGMGFSEMLFLFYIGIMFATLFVLSRNIFILWPIFQPFGQLITISKEDLPLPLIASVGFIEVLIVMFVIILILWKYSTKNNIK